MDEAVTEFVTNLGLHKKGAPAASKRDRDEFSVGLESLDLKFAGRTAFDFKRVANPRQAPGL